MIDRTEMATRTSNNEKAHGPHPFECCFLHLAANTKCGTSDGISARMQEAKPLDAISLAFIMRLAGLLEIFEGYRV